MESASCHLEYKHNFQQLQGMTDMPDFQSIQNMAEEYQRSAKSHQIFLDLYQKVLEYRKSQSLSGG